MTTTIIILVSLLLAMLALWGLARQLQKDLPITASSLLLGLGASVVMLAINLLLMRQAVQGLPELFGLALGLLFGLGWGQASRFSMAGTTVYARRSALHLLFWAVSLSLTQTLAWFAPAGWVTAGLATTTFAAGSTVGITLNHLVRYSLTARHARKTSE